MISTTLDALVNTGSLLRDSLRNYFEATAGATETDPFFLGKLLGHWAPECPEKTTYKKSPGSLV